MHHTLTKLIELSDNWIQYYEDDQKSDNPKYSDFYKGWETYFNGIISEMDEVKEQIKPDNKVYLEDELGDVLWGYICLLQIFEKNGYIKDTKKVFERCYKKLSERIDAHKKQDSTTYGSWVETKKKQKQELFDEHNCLYGCVNKKES
ncbi:nucleotide pyrophosphohydrolase [Candidatus Gracilibacteria bacterium]|nr:nucleotide pyrophosphohydrolase [Candidatus Gracilibacteria bacterium]